MIPHDAIMKSVLALYDEAYTGGSSWFTDGDERSGFPGLLAGVSAEQASRPLAGGGGLTAASHAGHVDYYLSLALRIVSGEKPYPAADWSGSWATRTVTEAEWQALVLRIGERAAAIRKVLDSPAPFGDEAFFTGCLALVCHGAWHLGALRQALGLITAPA